MAHDANKKIVPFVIKGDYKIFKIKRSLRIEFFEPIEIKTDNLDEANEMLMKFISDKLTDSEV